MCTVGIHYRERKLLSSIDVSEKAGKVLKTTDALDLHKLPAPLRTPKRIIPKLKLRLQSRRLQSADEFGSASQAELKKMAKNGFQKCFGELYKRW
ncbi:hypothetical protein TNCV_4507301 [Trichonephila clavipes]|nr:hypothetical protein TNCV_4507301 [Trichonephila clavipes]